LQYSLAVHFSLLSLRTSPVARAPYAVPTLVQAFVLYAGGVSFQPKHNTGSGGVQIKPVDYGLASKDRLVNTCIEETSRTKA
jgi:hypothetical protein